MTEHTKASFVDSFQGGFIGITKPPPDAASIIVTSPILAEVPMRARVFAPLALLTATCVTYIASPAPGAATSVTFALVEAIIILGPREALGTDKLAYIDLTATVTVAEMLLMKPIFAVPAVKPTTPATVTVALILFNTPKFAVPAARITDAVAEIFTFPVTVTVALILFSVPKFAVPAARITEAVADTFTIPTTVTVAEMLLITPILFVPAIATTAMGIADVPPATAPPDAGMAKPNSGKVCT